MIIWSMCHLYIYSYFRNHWHWDLWPLIFLKRNENAWTLFIIVYTQMWCWRTTKIWPLLVSVVSLKNSLLTINPECPSFAKYLLVACTVHEWVLDNFIEVNWEIVDMDMKILIIFIIYHYYFLIRYIFFISDLSYNSTV